MIRALCATFVATILACSVSVAHAAPTPVEVFGALPTISQAEISPSGKYVALIESGGGKTAVTTYSVDSKTRIGGIVAGKDQYIDDVSWYSDDRLIVTFSEVADVIKSDIVADICQTVAMNRDGTQVMRLGQKFGLACGVYFLRGPEPDTVILGSGPPQESSYSGVRQRGKLTLYSVNVKTDEAKIFLQAERSDTFFFMPDQRGRFRFRGDRQGGDLVYSALIDGSPNWVEVYRKPFLKLGDDQDAQMPGTRSPFLEFLAFTKDPNQLYVGHWPGDRYEIGVFDLQSKRVVSNVFSDPKYDVGGLIGLADGRVVGARIGRAVVEQVFFSDDWRQLQSLLVSSFPGHRVLVGTPSDDLNRFVVYIEGPDWPAGAYQVVDLKSSEAIMVGTRYPALVPGTVGEVKSVTYTARDGLKIDAFLTLPPGAQPGKKLPGIVFPHGGPAARDFGDFDWFSQFFASRGYAVLQPQYRGSTGFGSAFAQAGAKEWGGKMQHDVSDGVKYMIASGIVDQSRVCIAGWSYGGYAALAGATLTPELYRCVIAGAGVSDLVEMQAKIVERGGFRVGVSRYWRAHMGDILKEREKLMQVSPARQAAKVRAPLLLIHGELDTVVPIAQSEVMAKALTDAGKPFEFVRLPQEGHFMSFAPTRTKTLSAMEAFLLKHNPPN